MAQVSKKFNPVERDQILTELIKKEERKSKLSEVFSVPDPRWVPCPCNGTGASAPCVEGEDQGSCSLC